MKKPADPSTPYIKSTPPHHPSIKSTPPYHPKPAESPPKPAESPATVESPAKPTESPATTPRVMTRVFRRSLLSPPDAEPETSSPPHQENTESEPQVKLPLAVRKLQPYNKPGLTEVEVPHSNTRVTRQSKR